jgi:hypothetical protein
MAGDRPDRFADQSAVRRSANLHADSPKPVLQVHLVLVVLMLQGVCQQLSGGLS